MPRSIPTVHVSGRAEREVVPDEVVVTVVIRTPRQAVPAEALRLGVTRRGRVRAALAAGAPGAVVSDARVTTATERDAVQKPTCGAP